MCEFRLCVKAVYGPGEAYKAGLSFLEGGPAYVAMGINAGERLAGVLVPAFSLRRDGDLGIGDTAAVIDMVDWCARRGARVLQLLPINETSDDNSPYNAISAMAIEPTTLAVDPAHVPDLEESDVSTLADAGTLRALRSGPVNYPAVRELKKKLLWRAYENFVGRELGHDTRRAGEFRSFCREHEGWLPQYSLFRLLVEENGGNPAWTAWKAGHREPSSAEAWLASLDGKRREECERRREQLCYIQWLAYGQWQAVKAHADASDVRLMGDIPFGVSRCSADVWGSREFFDLDWSGGAPPEKTFAADQFTAEWGQNWGIPLYDWEASRLREFAWWRLRVVNTCRVFHIFRVDHVLGFFRVYAFPWTPDRNEEFVGLGAPEALALTGGRLPGFKPRPDDTPQHKEANRKEGMALLRVLVDAARDCVVVAEDLGVVPEYVPGALAELGMPGFAIPMFRRHPNGGYHHPDSYPELSVATPGTHDHPPLAAAWADWWRTIKKDPDSEGARRAKREVDALMEFAALGGKEAPRGFTAALHEGVLRATMYSRSWLALAMLTDVFGLEGRFNVPGVAHGGNWTFRMPCTVAEFEHSEPFRGKGEMFGGLIGETGRGKK